MTVTLESPARGKAETTAERKPAPPSPAPSAPEPHPVEALSPLLRIAEKLWDELPGFRVEILGGAITVTPPADVVHGVAVSNLVFLIRTALAESRQVLVVPAIGVWLGGADDDYAVADFAVVEADCADHVVKYNSCDPAVFRLILEVTSSNRTSDLTVKRELYAAAGIPVYVIVDRRDQTVLVLTDPSGDDYRTTVSHPAGSKFTLPESVGTTAEFEVDAVLGAAAHL